MKSDRCYVDTTHDQASFIKEATKISHTQFQVVIIKNKSSKYYIYIYIYIYIHIYIYKGPITAAVQSQADVCGSSSTRLTSLISAEATHVHLLCQFCGQRPFRQAGHSFRGVLPGVCVCVCVCVRTSACVSNRV